jgi:hypothetical protein
MSRRHQMVPLAPSSRSRAVAIAASQGRRTVENAIMGSLLWGAVVLLIAYLPNVMGYLLTQLNVPF